MDLFTLNRQARGQNHGALYSLIYSEDICLNYCCSFHTARFEKGVSGGQHKRDTKVQRIEGSFHKITPQNENNM